MLEIDPQQIESALEALKKGLVIVFPTETSYGLGCDATNTDAVARIFVIKGRPEGKGLPILIPDQEAADEYVVMSEAANRLAARHWPGPLNIVAPTREGSLVAEACSQDGMQSVRVSPHPVVSMLVRRLGRPLVATSANISGDQPIFDPKDVEKMFADRPDKPDAVVDVGIIPERPGSTTVRVIGDTVEVLRQGELKV